MKADFLDGISVFMRVVERRSFSGAAREIGVTPAAVSWTIKRLEERAGTPLLSRTTRSVGLTEAGALFFEHARSGMAHFESAFETAQRLGSRPSGLLRLTAPYVAQSLIEPFLPRFTAAHPDIELELAFEDRFVDLSAEGYDGGIRHGEMIAQDMIAVRLSPPSHFAVVGSPAYFNLYGIPERPEDLVTHNCIRFRQTGGNIFRWPFREDVHGGGIRRFDIAVKGSLIVNDPALSVRLAAAGAGLCYDTLENVCGLIESGKLIRCLENYMIDGAGFFLYFPRTSMISPKMRAFINFWKQEIYPGA
ncbi:LysR family transcriptional regulator [Enterobacter sp.]|uniref:LysR family transcriptional regulator n=1 Tax=Enterobacter sp. TaxID=42895 RepID=UPI00296F8158|nr:LysR family transcriptional regulator [Enterobacter sp.]